MSATTSSLSGLWDRLPAQRVSTESPPPSRGKTLTTDAGPLPSCAVDTGIPAEGRPRHGTAGGTGRCQDPPAALAWCFCPELRLITPLARTD